MVVYSYHGFYLSFGRESLRRSSVAVAVTLLRISSTRRLFSFQHSFHSLGARLESITLIVRVGKDTFLLNSRVLIKANLSLPQKYPTEHQGIDDRLTIECSTTGKITEYWGVFGPAGDETLQPSPLSWFYAAT